MAAMTLSPIQQRRLQSFRGNRRGYWSMWIFLVLFGLSLCAELIANDRPLVISYQGELMFPVVQDIPEERFGGFLPTEADYRDPFIREEIEANGWLLWPPIRYSYNTINYDLDVPSPAPPSAENWLGTDDDTGFLRWQGGPARPAVYRGVVRAADAVSADHSVQHRAAQFLVAAGYHAAVQLDGAGGCGACRIPAGP